MNESAVTFWQLTMALKILLAARVFRCEAGLKTGLKRIWAFLHGRREYCTDPKDGIWKVILAKGEKV